MQTAIDPATEQPGYLTTKQVTNLIQVAPRTLREMVRQGRFPRPATFGRMKRWPRAEVFEFLAAASRPSVEGR